VRVGGWAGITLKSGEKTLRTSGPRKKSLFDKGAKKLVSEARPHRGDRSSRREHPGSGRAVLKAKAKGGCSVKNHEGRNEAKPSRSSQEGRGGQRTEGIVTKNVEGG